MNLDLKLPSEDGGKSVVNQVLREMPYSEYLRTEHWRRVRERVLERCRWKCQCGERAWHAHHLTYENRGHEQPGDVIGLCAACHEKFHQNWTPAQ